MLDCFPLVLLVLCYFNSILCFLVGLTMVEIDQPILVKSLSLHYYGLFLKLLDELVEAMSQIVLLWC